eukprot:gene394-6808_t
MFRHYSTSSIHPVSKISSKLNLNEVKVSKMLKNLKISNNIKRNSAVLNFDEIFDTFAEKILKEEKYIKFYQNLSKIRIYDIERIENYFLKHFKKFIEKNFERETQNFEQIQELLQKTNPYLSFPNARKIKRKIIYHCGQTNSGKTYGALQALKSAKTGFYAAPLRLLAFEIYQTLNSENISCSLLTGEEIREVPESTHVSSTIEMIDTNQIFDVAVIDEMQMINDSDRGHAWTNALIGTNASEIHLCGDYSCVELVKKIVNVLDDEIEIKEYKRLNELVFEDTHFDSSWKRLKPRDCVIAFNRRDIFRIKQEIESATDYKCCIIYGGLPSETRLEQSDLYNDLNSGYSILIATDAIGMGLNLNIRRIVFYSLEKYERSVQDMSTISVSSFKQISGRAGRMAFFDKGYVTTFSRREHILMKSLAKQEISTDINVKAGIFPDFDSIYEFSKNFKNEKFSYILASFYQVFSVHEDFFLCNFDEFIEVAKILDGFNIPMIVKYDLMLAPFTRIEGRNILKSIASQMEQEKDEIEFNFNAPQSVDDNIHKMREVENMIKNLNAVCWLSIRYPDKISMDKTKQKMNQLINLLSSSLSTHTLNNKRKKIKISPKEKNNEKAFREILKVMKRAEKSEVKK